MVRGRRARPRETVLLARRRDRRRSRRSRLAVYGVAVLALLSAAVFGGAHLLTDRSTLARAVAWRESDIGDIGRFPASPVARAGTVSPLPADPRRPR